MTTKTRDGDNGGGGGDGDNNFDAKSIAKLRFVQPIHLTLFLLACTWHA